MTQDAPAPRFDPNAPDAPYPVRMGLTIHDRANATDAMDWTGAPNRATAISHALNLYRFILARLRARPGTRLAFVDPEGNVEAIVRDELTCTGRTPDHG